MSEPDDAPGPDAPTWQPVPPLERRVLGVLIEKQKTAKSPDAYPMTLNSIVLGCNQKSNRDPLTSLDEDEVEEILAVLQKKGVVVKMTGSRADRWRHQLYELWRASGVEMAILAELLLRGPQTEGDLRGRASRMDDIPDVDTLRGHTKALAARRLVVHLTPPDRRGTVVTHGFHTPEELTQARAKAGQLAGEAEPARAAASPGLEARLAEVEAEVARLRERLAALEARG